MELRRLNNELAQAKNAMTRFLAAASHDLLQPLNAARVFSAALAERDLEAHDRDLVGHVIHALDTTDELLSTLLDISRLDAGEMPMDVTDFQIADIMTALHEELLPLASEKGLRLNTVPCRIVLRSDKKMIRRILQNFLTNAIRYTPEGRILVGCKRAGEVVRVGVWDTGIGISEDKQSVIFREFQRLQSGTQQVDNGVGLGLAIVERIARQLGLRIVTRSRVGDGSYFGVEVPVGDGSRRVADDVARTGTPVRPALAGSDILVVDNEPSILRAMKALLESWSCRVIVATSGEEAMQGLQAANCVPDLVIADYHLDGGDIGLDVARDVRARYGAGIPLVVITADYEPEVASQIEGVGGHVLNKPVKPARLRALLSGLCPSEKPAVPAVP
jgi:CheY-like chemotaxis protein